MFSALGGSAGSRVYCLLVGALPSKRTLTRATAKIQQLHINVTIYLGVTGIRESDWPWVFCVCRGSSARQRGGVGCSGRSSRIGGGRLGLKPKCDKSKKKKKKKSIVFSSFTSPCESFLVSTVYVVFWCALVMECLFCCNFYIFK